MDERYFGHLKEVHALFYDQIRVADQKAAFLFSVPLALLSWSGEFGAVFTAERYATGAAPLVVVSAVAAVSLVVALLAALGVVLPRRLPGGSTLFWGNWQAQAPALLAAAQREDHAFLADEYTRSIDQLAQICRAKYRFNGFAFRSLSISMVAYVLLLFLA